MDRRNFLRGTFGGVVGGAALVKTVQGAPVDLWKPETPLVVIPELVPEVGLGLIVFNYRGQPLGVVTHMDRKFDLIDNTPAGAHYQQFKAGMATTYLTVVCRGTFNDVVAGRR